MTPIYGAFIMLKETYVFIDGAYLSKISRQLGKGKYIKFDLNQFAINITINQGLWCKGVYYYTAPPFQSNPPTAEEARRKSNYDKFVSKLNKIPRFEVREGRCQKVDGKYHQKGVDTILTMDLFEICTKKEVETIIILACDTDFVPILNRIRKMDIEVILYFYNDYIRGSDFSMSNHILTACDKSVLINIDLFTKSIKK